MEKKKSNKKIFIIIIGVLVLVIIAFIIFKNNSIKENTHNESTKSNVEETQYTTLLKDVVKIGDYIEYISNDEEFTIEKSETGASSDVKFETNDYEGSWRVMYNDEENGFQIISSKGVTNRLTLSGKFGYNNAIDTLNNFCNHYANNTDFAISGRCLGSNPTSPEDNSESEEHYSSGAMKVADENYKTDWEILNKYSLHSAGEETLLASRYTEKQGNDTAYQTYMYLRNISTSGDLKNDDAYLYSVPSEEMEREAKLINSSMDMTQSQSVFGNYIRAIITLKQDIKVKGGDGTKDNPYQLAK